MPSKHTGHGDTFSPGSWKAEAGGSRKISVLQSEFRDCDTLSQTATIGVRVRLLDKITFMLCGKLYRKPSSLKCFWFVLNSLLKDYTARCAWPAAHLLFVSWHSYECGLFVDDKVASHDQRVLVCYPGCWVFCCSGGCCWFLLSSNRLPSARWVSPLRVHSMPTLSHLTCLSFYAKLQFWPCKLKNKI